MLDWFRKLRKATRKLVLPSREANSARSQNKLDLSKFSPPVDVAIARLAAHQAILIEILGPCVPLASSSERGERIAQCVSSYRAQARKLAGELSKMGSDPADSLEAQEALLGDFANSLAGADYYERLASAYIGFGIIRDFFYELAGSYAKPQSAVIRKSLEEDDFWNWLPADLLAAMRLDARLANRLALWSRSIVADCLLEVWRTLGRAEAAAGYRPNRGGGTQFRELEPLVTALVARHSERMAKLELTA